MLKRRRLQQSPNDDDLHSVKRTKIQKVNVIGSIPLDIFHFSVLPYFTDDEIINGLSLVSKSIFAAIFSNELWTIDKPLKVLFDHSIRSRLDCVLNRCSFSYVIAHYFHSGLLSLYVHRLNCVRRIEFHDCMFSDASLELFLNACSARLEELHLESVTIQIADTTPKFYSFSPMINLKELSLSLIWMKRNCTLLSSFISACQELESFSFVHDKDQGRSKGGRKTPSGLSKLFYIELMKCEKLKRIIHSSAQNSTKLLNAFSAIHPYQLTQLHILRYNLNSIDLSFLHFSNLMHSLEELTISGPNLITGVTPMELSPFQSMKSISVPSQLFSIFVENNMLEYSNHMDSLFLTANSGRFLLHIDNFFQQTQSFLIRDLRITEVVQVIQSLNIINQSRCAATIEKLGVFSCRDVHHHPTTKLESGRLTACKEVCLSMALDSLQTMEVIIRLFPNVRSVLFSECEYTGSNYSRQSNCNYTFAKLSLKNLAKLKHIADTWRRPSVTDRISKQTLNVIPAEVLKRQGMIMLPCIPDCSIKRGKKLRIEHGHQLLKYFTDAEFVDHLLQTEDNEFKMFPDYLIVFPNEFNCVNA